MRSETDRAKLERFMRALGERVQSEGTIYLTGGATALLFGWRDTTIDIDIKADPEPRGLFEAIAMLKETLDINHASARQAATGARSGSAGRARDASRGTRDQR